MGKIYSGILGGFSGKVGPVIGGAWKGINYMRSKPTSVANPNTSGQQAQRNAFRSCVEAGQALLGSIIQVLWNPIAQKMSGYNDFMSANTQAFDLNGDLIPANFSATRGALLGVATHSAVADQSLGSVAFTWTNNAGTGNALLSDKAVLCYYNETQGYWKSEVTSTNRSVGAASISDSRITAGDTIQTYLSFHRDGDYSLASPSSYTGIVAVP